MKLLTKEHQKSYENAKICCLYKAKFENKYLRDKKCCKVRDHCHYWSEEYRGFAHSICKLKYSVSRNIPLLFHNGLNYGYHSSLKS